ncbi:hypothetical protein IG193_07145 [Infirmifilum lucidum]|uniref:Uncharacterized protein n=1 Tax=Infirmifilum lucidum TaxID=2776706 RepID=A0A7L9FHY7_9CREN|nr:hypothetical protein [Infirmifilum lucidum]QOJ78524.1 hypothetical protein IG193_07145 [Infirmifilum lucidum]
MRIAFVVLPNHLAFYLVVLKPQNKQCFYGWEEMEEITMEEFLKRVAGKRIRVKQVVAPPPGVVIESMGNLYLVKVK